MKKLLMTSNKEIALKAKQGLSLMLGSVKSASLGISASVLALAVGGNPVAFAQERGTSASPTFEAKAMAHSLAAVEPAPSMVWTNANYGTGGVALRNRGAGSISVSGVTGAVRAAFIYWAVIGPDTASNVIILERRFPIPAPNVVLTGTVVSSGPNPCWVDPAIPIVVYRATVPLNIAIGNGDYEVRLFPGEGGSTAGDDPWVGTPITPLWEGASIVMVGTGGGTVNLFDGLPGGFFIPPFSYSLALAGPGLPATSILWDNIGADGQVGTSRSATASVSGETTTISGVLVAGPGSALNLTGDWNGSSGFPLPQLWDDTGHAFTLGTPASTLDITFGPAGQSDCLTTVANVVQFPFP